MDEYLVQALKLTTNYIATHSVGIVIRDRAGNTATGSSVCIRVGPHLLLATAAHVIEDVLDSRIQLVPAGELSQVPAPFEARSCGPSRSAPATDVAWFELDPAAARDLRFLELSELRPSQLLDRERSFAINGYPYESAIITPSTADLEATVGMTKMADPQEHPRPLRSHEIALEYPPRDAHGRPMTGVPHPKGVSGGGTWWQPRHDEYAVLSPERLRLVGVNTLWDKASSILFATRIEYWLRLVAQDFPDARHEIAAVRGA